MPLMRYFCFVGSALVLLLFGISWWFPQPAAEPVRNGLDRPIIRISSVEKLPERVYIDAGLPTIVPPLGGFDVEQPPVARPASQNDGPQALTQMTGHDGSKKPGNLKRDSVKKVAAHPLPKAPKPNFKDRPGSQVASLSLFEALKERLSHGLFRAN